MRIALGLLVLTLLYGPVRAQPKGHAAGWKAGWIAAPWSTERDGAELDGSHPMPVFRREFEVRGQVLRATLRIAGLGQFDAQIDGQPVGPAGLHQAWTDYRKTIAYQSYDVTLQVKPGRCVLAVELGNGMYNVQKSKGRYTKFNASFGVPKLTAELRIAYRSGRVETIVSDGSWQTARGPVVFDSTYGGEDFDARKLQAGWNRAGFNAAGWMAAKVVDGPGGELVPALAPEMIAAEQYVPVKTSAISPAVTVYDLGQNFAGVPAISVEGPAGATLKLTPGELLKPDRTVSQASSGGPMWWSYTLSGAGTEQWQPQFGYYGFRYLQAEWIGAAGKLVSVHGVALHSASPVAGSFESSSPMLNAIHKLIVAAMHNNEASIFTDCPHREKLGWLEQTHLVADGLMYNNDLRGLYAATDRNIADAQHGDGLVPTTAPQYTVFGAKYSVFDDSPEWGSAAILAPWAAYRFYGDRTQLERDYPVMQRYLAYLQGRAVDGIVAYGLGDWYDIGPGDPGKSKLTTLGVTGTLMLYQDAVTIAKIAALLGKADDAARYQKLAQDSATAFTAKFFHADQGVYDEGSQTAQAMPLALGMVPAQARAGVLAHLIDDIHAHHDHITTGEIGFPYLVEALLENGRSDVLLAMMLRTDSPSYGSQLAAGATALTEAWDANPRNSQDHFMLGGAEAWFYGGLGGIDVDQSRAQAERIVVAPQFPAGVDWVRTSYRSTLGTVRVEWKRGAGGVMLDVTVPVTSTIVVQGSRRVVTAGEHHVVVRP